MILRVTSDTSGVVLVDPERFDELKLVAPADQPASAIAGLLGPGAEVDGDGHLRVPARTIVRLAGPRPTPWHVRYGVMLNAVEPMGWYDAATDTVRVHIETHGDGR